MEFATSNESPEEPGTETSDDARTTAVRAAQTASAVEAAFAAPAGSSWSRVSPALTLYNRLALAGVLLPATVIAGAVAGFALGAAWAVAVVVPLLAIGVAGWLTAPRARASWGYAEGRTDFYLTCGVVIRQLVVVPYGRMQVVDVTANLLEQALGIATVRLRTAATTADARIPGLSLDEATRLRDRLAARSETFSTGL
ncbi:PH domain-containing protein [Marinactinospora rubrisoli]|uniref:PH domain-containing protein n=1 Tax=Marinactinospora rubrisoli TaxID=2715399 RepID=A0ABW2KJ71_9ACTN